MTHVIVREFAHVTVGDIIKHSLGIHNTFEIDFDKEMIAFIYKNVSENTPLDRIL